MFFTALYLIIISQLFCSRGYCFSGFRLSHFRRDSKASAFVASLRRPFALSGFGDLDDITPEQIVAFRFVLVGSAFGRLPVMFCA
jgi:hypothetical protein